MKRRGLTVPVGAVLLVALSACGSALRPTAAGSATSTLTPATATPAPAPATATAAATRPPVFSGLQLVPDKSLSGPADELVVSFTETGVPPNTQVSYAVSAQSDAGWGCTGGSTPPSGGGSLHRRVTTALSAMADATGSVVSQAKLGSLDGAATPCPPGTHALVYQYQWSASTVTDTTHAVSADVPGDTGGAA